MKKPADIDDEPVIEPVRPDYSEFFPDDAALVALLEQDAKRIDKLRLLGHLSAFQFIEMGVCIGIPVDEMGLYLDMLQGDVEIPPEAVRHFSGTV